MWITQASLERIESKNTIDCSMNTGASTVENNTEKRLLYTLKTPYNLHLIEHSITPITALGAQIDLQDKQP